MSCLLVSNQLAQTRQQQVDKDERARLASDPKALKAYEKSIEKRKQSEESILAAIEKEERRYEMESFYSYVRSDGTRRTMSGKEPFCLLAQLYSRFCPAGQVTLIRSKIGTIDDGRDDMWKISSQAMVSVNDEQVAELSSRMELISARTNKNAQEIRQLVKELEEKNKHLLRKYPADSAYMRIRLLQVSGSVFILSFCCIINHAMSCMSCLVFKFSTMRS